MANQLKIELWVDDKGTVHVKQFAKEAAKDVKELGDESDSVSSRMQAGWEKVKSSWIAVTAAIAAALYTMKKGWDELNLIGRVDQERRAFENLAQSYGTSGDVIIAALKRVSGETITVMDAIHTAGSAMMMGIAPDDIIRLMEVARTTTRMTGQTMTEAFRNIAEGVARQSKLTLDNLGIIISVDQANQAYARTLRKSAEQLTDIERKQAFMNATLKAGEELTVRLGTQVDTFGDKLSRLSAKMSDAKLRFELWVADLLIPPNALEQLELRRVHILDEIMTKEAQLKELAADSKEQLTILANEFYYRPGSSELLEDLKALRAELVKIDAQREALKALQRPSEKPGEGGAGPMVDVVGWEAALAEIQRYRVQVTEGEITGWQAALAEIQRYRLEETNAEITGWEVALGEIHKYGLEQTKQTFDFMKTLADETARNMHSAFSDFFFEAMRGDLENLGDYFSAFLTAMERSIASLMSYGLLSKMGFSMPALVSHIGGIVGETPFPLRMVPASAFEMAPRLHAGLRGDEFPAILQRGETVSPKGAGGVTVNLGGIHINAVDAASFTELVRRNPGAITGTVIRALQRGGPLNQVIRAAT
jgi:hypothetical protein